MNTKEQGLTSASGSTDEILAWKRYVEFTYEGEGYVATLCWSEWEGYELFFSETPRWYSELAGENKDALHYELDEMTC